MNERDVSTAFAKKISYQFRDAGLLKNALTHSSYINESRQCYTANNERLEFLGDAVFDAVISDDLYRRLSDVEEGILTKTRASIVCEESLAECGRALRVGDDLLLGKGEENSGGRSRSSILADAMEAVIGAIYLDGGFENAKSFVLEVFSGIIEEAMTGKLHKDYKTELQECLQAKGAADIHYEIEKEEGPDHDKLFFVNLYLEKELIGKGQGRSKKEAERDAARNALREMEACGKNS